MNRPTRPTGWRSTSEQRRTFSRIELAIYDDRGGVQPPTKYEVEYWDGKAWQSVRREEVAREADGQPVQRGPVRPGEGEQGSGRVHPRRQSPQWSLRDLGLEGVNAVIRNSLAAIILPLLATPAPLQAAEEPKPNVAFVL